MLQHCKCPWLWMQFPPQLLPPKKKPRQPIKMIVTAINVVVLWDASSIWVCMATNTYSSMTLSVTLCNSLNMDMPKFQLLRPISIKKQFYEVDIFLGRILH